MKYSVTTVMRTGTVVATPFKKVAMEVYEEQITLLRSGNAFSVSLQVETDEINPLFVADIAAIAEKW